MSKEAEESRKNLSIHPEWRKKKKQKKFDFPQEPKGIGKEAFAHYCASNPLQFEERNEWDFSQLDLTELMTCRDYEMGREAVLLEKFYKQKLKAKQFVDSEWLETRVTVIRRTWQLTGFASYARENPAWFISPASRVLVLYPEWPDMPYLKIDRKDRLQRVEELSIPTLRLADLLDPLNPATGKKCVGKIAIPECLTREDLIKAFTAWLKVYFPEQGKSTGKNVYPKRQGRGSDKAAVADHLNALAAHRLCRRARVPRAKVIKLIKHPPTGKNPGTLVYRTEKQLDKPLNRVREGVETFWGQIMSDLEPLGLLNLSQPDFTLL